MESFYQASPGGWRLRQGETSPGVELIPYSMEPSPSPRLAGASDPELSALRVIPAEGELTETKQPYRGSTGGGREGEVALGCSGDH